MPAIFLLATLAVFCSAIPIPRNQPFPTPSIVDVISSQKVKSAASGQADLYAFTATGYEV